MALPVINNYKDLMTFNKSLIASNKNLPELNVEKANLVNNTIIVNGEAHFVDEFLYNYIVNHIGILTGKVVGLSRYDYSKLNYLLHPENKDAFISSIIEYANNVLLLGGNGEFELWDFTVTIEGRNIVLKRHNKEKAKEVFIPSFISKIDNYAFAYQEITKVIIEEGSQLKSIGDKAFIWCEYLTSINLPEELEDIGMGAFTGCEIMEIFIPSKVKRIKEATFGSCKRLAKVIFKSNLNLEYIEGDAFRSCHNLSEISLPSSLLLIGSGAFQSCSALRNIEVPDSVVEIMDSVFESSGLERIVLGRQVRQIPKGAFYACHSLEEVTPLGLLEKIGDSAFEMSSIPEITIQSSVKQINRSAFRRCNKLARVIFESGSQLRTIEEGAFGGCSHLQIINLPEGLEKIERDSFIGCSLKEITLPSTTKVIGDRAFYDCRTLRKLKLPTSLETIGATSFGACNSLKTIEIPDSVKTLELQTFGKCADLESIIIGRGVREIPTGESYHCFHDCTSLKKIVFLGDIDKLVPTAFTRFGRNSPTLEVYIPKTSKFEPSKKDEKIYGAKIIKA